MRKFVITNAILVDKQNHFPQVKKAIFVENGLIAAIDDCFSLGDDVEIIDVEGAYLCAGMIDIHIHNRQNLPGGYFDDPDDLGVYRGVTSMIECGTVCIKDCDEFIAQTKRVKTRYYGLLSGHGEEGFSRRGSQNIDEIHLEHYQEIFNKYPDELRGIKIANSRSHTGDLGYLLTRHAKEIANSLNVPLTIHVGNFPPDPCGLIEFLNQGDVVTHTYHSKEISLFKEDGTPKESFVRARNRGVLFDVGHGSESFSWQVFDKAIHKGFYPDIISTDLRKLNAKGPVYSLAVVMSKMLSLHMTLEDVVEAVTYRPAQTYHLEGLGELKVGYKADFTLFNLEEVTMELQDCYEQVQPIHRLIVPKTTIISKGDQSEEYQCTQGLLTK